MAIEAKRDIRVVVPYTVITLALFGALFVKACTWQQFLAGLALLNVPAFFGLKKSNDDDGTPPAQTPVFVDERTANTMPSAPLKRGALISGVVMLAACAAAATPQQKNDAADATYAADMARCVDEATTLAESKACRANVRATWHVDGGVPQ